MYHFGLIGYPIKQSLSPWIHKQFLTKANLSGSYLLYELNPEKTSLKDEVALLKDKLDGFNVTVPYKRMIIPYLDELDPTAKSIGAVNTVVNEKGRLTGYNTDGIGYVRSLEGAFPYLFMNRQPNILMIGAGGAARGIYQALVNRGFTKIDLTNRTTEVAEKIAQMRGEKVQTNVFSLNDIHNVIDTFDLIIQTTSVGMKPQSEEKVLQVKTLKHGVVVSDIVYQPIYTAFLQQAKAVGADIHYGHTMLLYQALYAFEIWTNQTVVFGNMANNLKDVLGGV